MDDAVTIEVEGRTVTSGPSCSIIEAIWESGYPLVTNVGCLGQGVCGSCRVMVTRDDDPGVRMEFACETVVEPGMQVAFVAHLEPVRTRHYDVARPRDSWDLADDLAAGFPEAEHCRHCGGCDSACPRGIQVQLGVNLAVGGRLSEAGDTFDECVMCGLCTEACPESIDPNHLGLWTRRVTTSAFVRPANLVHRLGELARGEHTIERTVVDQ